jgi:hypothetical protein
MLRITRWTRVVSPIRGNAHRRPGFDRIESQPVHAGEAKRARKNPPRRVSRIAVDEPVINYAANARRTAAASICSACSVNREPLMKPMRFKVRSATGSHSSAETPSANIAMTRCSSASRSVHEMPSIARLGSSIPTTMIRPRSLKIY